MLTKTNYLHRNSTYPDVFESVTIIKRSGHEALVAGSTFIPVDVLVSVRVLPQTAGAGKRFPAFVTH